MDPLSITAGTIAVIGAVRQTSKALQGLRAIRQAPTEIQSLLEEVIDLDTLLKQIQTDSKHRSWAADPPANHDQNGLDRQVCRASAKLGELTSLLESHSTTQKVAGIERGHFSWRRGRRTASVIREDLKLIRMNITASLGALSVSTTERNQTTVERLEKKYDETIRQLAASIENLTLLTPSFNPPTFEVAVGKDSQGHSFDHLFEPSDNCFNVTNRLSNKFGRMTRHPKVASRSDSESLLQIYAKKPKTGCMAWCSCSCHKTSSLRINKPNNLAVGSLALTFSGMPYITASCDQRACALRSTPLVRLTIQFPKWLWNGYVSSSFAYNPLEGSQLNLRLPRAVGWSSRLWGYGTEGNVKGIQKLFSQGLASPWDVQGLGGSALHYAADHKHWELCKFLTELGAQQDLEDDFNNTPAELAWDHILSGSLSEDIACQVAGVFSNTDFLQSRQFTVLHKIVLKLIPKDLKTELEYSTKELDVPDSSGHTCTSWAAKRGDIEALQILLSYGADPNIPDIHGNAPLHHVRNVDCCNILLCHGADASATNRHGHTILHTICRGDGQFQLLRRLIEAGVDLNVQDHQGEAVAMTAVWNKHHECAQHLIKNGADLEVANISGDRLIHFAIMVNFHHILELLLDRGARTDGPNAYGETILHFAARLSDSETVRILKRFGVSGVDVDALNHEQKNARHYLEEREADEQDADFRKHFEKLLSDVASNSQKKGDILSITDQMAALNMAKETIVSCYTPLTTDDENDDFEDAIGKDRSEHGPVLYYDAVEELCQVEEVVV